MPLNFSAKYTEPLMEDVRLIFLGGNFMKKENNFLAPVWFFGVMAIGMIAQAIVLIRSINLAEDTMKWCKVTYSKCLKQLGVEDE